MNSKEKIDGERSLGGARKNSQTSATSCFAQMARRVPSLANRAGSISEEGVAIAPSVGRQNPAIAQWRQTEEYG
jgi:hypothetical protein